MSGRMTIVVDGRVILDRCEVGEYTLDEEAGGDVMLIAKFAPIPTGSVAPLLTGTFLDGAIMQVEL